MSLTSLELDLLVAIDQLTRDSYLPTEQDEVFVELARMGVEPPNAMWLYHAAEQLRDDGYIEAYFAGGMTIVNLKLTREGREAARTARRLQLLSRTRTSLLGVAAWTLRRN